MDEKPVFKYIKSVTIFGYAECEPDSDLYKETFEVAKTIAEYGLEVINGGGPGVMRAATEGAHAGGGKVTVSSFYPKFVEHFEGRDRENKADKEIIRENYLDRTLKLLELGNAYVVMNGGTGTLSEFGMAWGLAYLYFGHHKPLILYGDFWYEVTESLVKNMMIGNTRPRALEVYKIANSPQMVIKHLLYFEKYLEEHKEDRDHPATDDGSGETAFIN